ncbi:MAG: hypothetical protein ACOY5U_10890 [Pseudomonadota bacterium]
MTDTRYILTLLLALGAAAATVALAAMIASFGVPLWQAAIGPLLLLAFLALRWRSGRR